MARWTLGVLNVPPEAYNPNVTVVEQNQRLEITPLSNTDVWSHNGYVSAATYNLTGTYATVKVPPTAVMRSRIPSKPSPLAVEVTARTSNPRPSSSTVQ